MLMLSSGVDVTAKGVVAIIMHHGDDGVSVVAV